VTTQHPEALTGRERNRRLNQAGNDIQDLYDLVGKVEQDVSYLKVHSGLVNAEFQKVHGRLDGIDQRLGGIDQRLGGIDQRLDGMDRRFDGMDRQLALILERLPVRGGE